MKILKIEVQCPECITNVLSPIFFGDTGSFDTTELSKNITKCTMCLSDVPIDKEDMRVITEDGKIYYKGHKFIVF